LRGQRGRSGRDTAAARCPHQQRDACRDAAEAGELGVRHTPQNAGIDAQELHEEPGDAGEDEVLGQDAARGARLPCPEPQPGADRKSAGKFVQGCGMHGNIHRIDAVREGHSPGQMRRLAVAPVAGKEAADAANAVSERGCGRSQIEYPQTADFGAYALNHQRGDAEDEASEPGEAAAIPESAPTLLAEVLRGVDDVPELGADDAGDHGDDDHGDGVGGDVGAPKAALHDEASSNGGQPEHESERGDFGVEGAEMDMDVGIHLYMKYRRGGNGEDSMGERDFYRRRLQRQMRTGDTGFMATIPQQGIEVLYTRDQIAARVAELGAAITRDLKGEKLVMVGVLKGAAPFLSDLARAVQVDATFDFVAVSSYGKGHRTSGAVKLIKDLDETVEGKNVLIVEDILDTGLTLNYLRKLILQQKPKSLRIAALLDKPSRRIEKIDADYVGFSIPNLFVIGYGMDYAERYRNLPDICLMTPDHPE
jgi:hypoxanthine phosphoribosyltransferase